MVNIRCRQKPSFRSELETKETLVLFDLESVGVNQGRFLSTLMPTFEQLEWDYYDVRREQLGLLGKHVTISAELARNYYAGAMPLEALLESLAAVSPDVLKELHSFAPYRRRSTAKLELASKGGADWEVKRIPNHSIQQQVATTDYRSMPRTFKETSVEVLENEEFSKLLLSLGNMVREAEANVKVLQLTCWQVGVLATPRRAGSNSPEGIHQDGADYIVSALVVERDNILGGTSRVFAPNKETQHLEVTLNPGQGIFQADAGSSLWHDVTPIKPEDPVSQGVRCLFGFDINVISRE